MTPGAYNLIIRRGVAFSITFTLTEDDGTTAINLTGYTAHALVRKLPTSAVVKDLTPTLTSAAGGIITIALTDEQTLALPAGAFRWDLVLEDAGGSRLGPYVAGLCDISSAITRDE
jgi:hypothetical protein